MAILVFSRRALWVAISAVAAGLLAWAVFEFQPSRQLHRTFEKFVTTGERRDWETAASFLASDYRDDWGHDRETGIATASELLGHFFFLEITTNPVKITVNGSRGEVRTRPRLAGNGTAIAQYVMTRANELQQEMTFVWRRESWKPWDWKLVSVHQPEISG